MYFNKDKPIANWFIFIVLILFISETNASHFRYGTLTWTTSPDNPYLYQFSLKIAFRASYFLDNSPYRIPSIGDEITNFNIYFFNSLDDYKDSLYNYFATIEAKFIVNNVDKSTGNDWLTAEMIFTRTFKTSQKEVYVTYNAKARIGSLINNANSRWNVGTSIILSPNGGSSPKTGILPIMNAYVGVLSNWQVPLIDDMPTGATYKYELSDSSEMPGNQPSGITLSPSGLISFSPNQAGLYSGQIKISKFVNGQYFTSIVVDFIIKSINKPSTNKPPIFIYPTPEIGSIVNMTVMDTKSIQIVGTSPQTTSKVTISLGSLPKGLTHTDQVNNPTNVGTVSLNWKPTETQIGVYVVALGLTDDKGLSLAQGIHTFYIRVFPQICNGNGNIVDGKCVCKPNWIGENCTECAPGHYGPNCTQLPTCVHGTSNGGLYGDGTCVCDKDWYEVNCNFSLSQSCDPNRKNSIILQSSTVGNIVYPGSVILYLLKGVNTPVNVRAALPPSGSIPIDFFFVLDTTFDNFYNLLVYKTFLSSFDQLEKSSTYDNVRYGFGTFSDTSTSTTLFQLISPLKNSIANEVSKIKPVDGSTGRNYQYIALIDALSKVQWTSSGSLKVMILVSDNYLSPSDSTLIGKLSNSLAINNVLLGVFVTKDVNSYDWIKSYQGIASKWNTVFGGPGMDQMIDEVVNPITELVSVSTSGDVSFINSGPTSISTGVYDTKYIYPSSFNQARVPEVTLTFNGYGNQKVKVFTNNPPTTSNIKFTINENTNNSFDIKASDPDGNALSITFTAAPSKGSIYINGVKVVQGLSYNFVNTPNSFLYVPNVNIFGIDQASYTISDGCQPVNGVIDITINDINLPPVCNDYTLDTDQTTSQTFSMSTSDPDGDASTISFQSLSKINAIGSINLGGSIVIENTQYPSTSTFSFIPNSFSTSTSISIPVIVSDSKLKGQCQLNVNLVRKNVGPSISISTQLSMRPDTTLQIPFTVIDTDPNESITIAITSITPMSGKFYDSKSVWIQNTPFSLGTVSMTTNTYSSGISYEAINANQNGISFTIEVTDKDELKDTKSVTIDVSGSVSQYPPVATQVGPIKIIQNTKSEVFVLNGSHPYQPGYTGLLNVFINSPPQFGSIFKPDGSNLGSMVAPLSVIYKPNTEKYYEKDFFTFSVIDDQNLKSDPVTVEIGVKKQDYPPIIQLNPVSLLTQLSCSDVISPSPISISVDNINVMENLKVNVIRKPTLGSLIYNGVVIDQVPTLIDHTIGIQYLPLLNSFISYQDDYQIEACDVKCSNINGTINSQIILSSPTGQSNNKIETIQNQNVDFKIVGNDCQYPNNITFQFYSLPKYGVLLDSNGEVVLLESVFTSNSFRYVPNQDVSDLTRGDGSEPLESFSYLVTNSFNMNSPSYSIKISVHPIPTFTGERNLTTLENTELEIPIKASAPDGKQFTMNILSFTGNGYLYYFNRNGSKINILSSGSSFDQTSYKLFYLPPKDVYGKNIDSFKFTLNQTYYSEVYTIYIDVEHIFKPPTIIPLTYTKNGTIYPISNENIELYVNSSTIITFNVTSPDHKFESLVSSFGSTALSAGVFCQLDQSAIDQCGEKVTMDSIINRHEEGLWKLVFVPKKGRSGMKIAPFTIVATDPYNKTDSQRLFISVLRINIPPIVSIPQPLFNTTATTGVILNNVTVYDPDSTDRNNITFTLTLTSKDGSDDTGSINIPFANSRFCNISSNVVTCVDKNNMLNIYLQTLSVNFQSKGQYQLVVYVNDLGYNAMNPNEWKLSDSKTIEFNVLPSPSSGGKKNNTVVISAAIAAAAVAAAAIALGVWRIMKVRAPPTDAFFGDAAFAEGTVSTNPLYQENQNNMTNPLYEGTDNI